MADHDPYPMRSEEARRLAASVRGGDDDDDDDDECTGNDAKADAATTVVVVDNVGPSWHRMGTSLAQRLPKFFKGGRGRESSGGSNVGVESLLVGSGGGGGVGGKRRKKREGGGDKDESIYDRDDLDEARGVENDDEYDEDDENGEKDDDDDDDDGGNDDFIDAPSRRGANRALLRPQDVSDLPWPVGPLALCVQRCYYSTRTSAKYLHRRMYGDTWSWDDFLRTMVLSSTLFVMIGGYWLLRSLKDVVMTALCGVESIPKAKMLSVFVVLGIVAIYNHLLDSSFRKEQLFYVFGTFYLVLFSCIAYLLGHPTIGLANQVVDPSRVLGWVSYCGIESFGSVMVALFWSFANSSFNLKQAKRSYGVMVATAQLGSILGPTFVNKFSLRLGIPTCYMVGASCMLTLQFTMWVYVKMFGAPPEVASSSDKYADETKDDVKKKPKAGILEGIHLFVNHNYVKGIFAISCLYEVEVTIVDYTMKVLASDFFATEHPCAPYHETTGEAMSCWNFETNSAAGMSTNAAESFTAFMGLFGQATNTLSFVLSFFGTSAVIRYLGLRTTLLLFPSICLMVIITVRMYPSLNVVFAAMMILKANSYALNNPTKEMLYQPTSSNVKYKAKSWIDIFGMRGSKALGSVVTNSFASSIAELVDKGSIVGMGVAGFLIWNARFMGRKFEEYTDSGYIVGETNEDDDYEEEYSDDSDKKIVYRNVEMASRQNTESDTSCAFYDDDEIGADEEGQSESELGNEEDGSDTPGNVLRTSSSGAIVELV